DRVDRQRLEVDRVGDLRVGHDRRRVAVDEDRPDAFGAERAAGLCPGVVEFGGLADDDRAGAEDQDRLRLVAGPPRRTARGLRQAATNRSKTASASSGPGAPSGWYWTVSIGRVAWRRPSTEPSFRFTWLTWNPEPAGSESPTTWTSWFWAVTWTRPWSTSRTGWLAPWWPNRSRPVSAPAARATIWGPRQIPSSGRPSSITAPARPTGPAGRAGSPGPGDRITPSMSGARATAVEIVGGRIRTRAPRSRIARTMFDFSP